MTPVWLMLVACASPPQSGEAAPPTEEPAPASEDPVPAELVEMVDGDELRSRLTAPSDGLRLVNFWATWCGPCKAELPHLKAWAEAHDEVEVVLVNLDYPTLRDKAVVPFIEAEQLTGLTHWQLDEKDGASALRTAVPDWPDAVPVTLLIDAEGTITKRFARALGPADFAQLP